MSHLCWILTSLLPERGWMGSTCSAGETSLLTFLKSVPISDLPLQVYPHLIFNQRLKPIGPLYGTQIWCGHSQDSGACPSIEQYGQTSAIHCLNNFSRWSSVRYQGYVCPGILVTLAGEEEVSFLQSAWESYSILCPQDLSILRFVKDEINETEKWIPSDWGSHRDVQ